MASQTHQDFLDAVRQAGDLVRLVSEYVPLKPAGSRLKGLCPFHQEKTPSFSVDPERQLFYCFGCQAGGDLFKFVMLYEKVGFREAVELLARRWGVPLPVAGRSHEVPATDRMVEINQAARVFFRNALADPGSGARAREYLRLRRIDEPTALRLELGYAPDSWSGLGDHLLGRRFKADELLRAGLVLPRKSGGHYDRFRDRLIFTIRDLGGRPVAFGGRTLGDAEPKYINSPETPVYTKGEHLYGLDLAREAIRRETAAIVVEGYLDLAALVQAGFDNVVASLGTAFTPAQARLLARYTHRVVFSYDGDSAGATATERSLDLLLEQGFEVRVVELPAGSDPDDVIGAQGAAAYRRLLLEAPDYLEFLIHRESRNRDLRQIEQKVAAVNALLPHLVRLANPIQRAAWASKVADALAIEDHLVLQELRTAARARQPEIRQRPPGTRRPSDAECRLVARLLASADERAAMGEIAPEDLEGLVVAPIVEAIVRLDHEGQPVSYPTVLDLLEDDGDRERLTRLAFMDEPEEGPSVADCLWSFRRRRLAREGRRAVREVDKLQNGAGQAPAPDEVDRRLLRVQELARQRDALS